MAAARPPSRHALAAMAAARRLGRTLVLAPHPDDETIGCGGLLALLAQAGVDVHVVLLSDGAASHPGSALHPPARLRTVRQQEMVAALQELGHGPQQLTALGLHDGAIPGPEQRGFEAALKPLAELTATFKPDSVVLPWRHDAHPDHRATHALGAAACRRKAPLARRLEYVVWADPIPAAPASAWHLDVASVLARKRRALRQHRSQLGQVVRDDPAGFRLPAALVARCGWPVETYLCYPPGPAP